MIFLIYNAVAWEWNFSLNFSMIKFQFKKLLLQLTFQNDIVSIELIACDELSWKKIFLDDLISGLERAEVMCFFFYSAELLTDIT